METIKVNMSPNPLDVQTIHASQNDGEARQWEFELHNNGELIDTSDVKEQLVFKAYEGGTEEILPTNGSTPTTSPFKGDIRYPQGLLTDQEFIYRQSPTQSDGNAKIQAIYGNTLKWNQLVRNGNFADGTKYYYVIATTLTASNGVLTITKNQNAGAGIGYASPANFKYVVGHKYLARVDYKGIAGKMLTLFSNSLNAGMIQIIPTDENWHTVSNIFNVTSLPTVPGILWLSYDTTTDDNVAQFRNYAIFDLTAMGLDTLTDDEVKQWFADYYPLPYYQYDSGSLLSFRGEGLKTVGKNLFEIPTYSTTWAGLNISSNKNDGIIIQGSATASGSISEVGNYVHLIKGKQYSISGISGGSVSTYYLQTTTEDLSTQLFVITDGTYQLTPTEDMTIFIRPRVINGATLDVVIKTQVEFGDASSYEPYTSSTLSLPISTYFPTGMKSAGSVYDELTESKAITRVGMVDLGTLNYTRPENSSQFRSTTALQNAKLPSRSTEMLNAKSALYNATDYITMINSDMALTIVFSGSFAQGQVWIKNSNYTDVTAFKTAMSGVYLYYELATPTETSFTTASLVTENAEIPLSNNDGVLIGKCTEQLSAEPGFHDAKIKLTDADGECYSNKLQLHVERSPQ